MRAAAAAQVFVDDPSRAVLSDEDQHHLSRVLRLRDGEEVIAGDGRGRWARKVWRGGPELERHRGAAGVGGDGSVQHEARDLPALTVAFAPVKGERPEWVVQKLTELGIDRIVPLYSERSVVRWTGERGTATVERLRRVAREAAAQCRRVWLPEVSAPIVVRRARFFRFDRGGGPGPAERGAPDAGPPRRGCRARGRVEQRGAGRGPADGRVRAQRPAGRDGGGHGRSPDGLVAHRHGGTGGCDVTRTGPGPVISWS